MEALAVVTGIMTVITFATQTASLCKTIYEGRPTADGTLQDKATSMTKAIVELETHCGRFKPVSADEEELLELARKCRQAATALKSEAQSLQPQRAKGRFRKSVVGALKSRFSKPKIESLEQSLQQHEVTLQTGLLTRIW